MNKVFHLVIRTILGTLLYYDFANLSRSLDLKQTIRFMSAKHVQRRPCI
jgi:hypothetical protein